jgi:sulfur relay protein TusB/DsrH
MLYLLGDKIIGPTGLKLAEMDSDAVVVLIKDGVFLDTQGLQGKKIYAIDEDVKRRGMAGRLEGKAEVVGYDTLVDLILANKVANFV